MVSPNPNIYKNNKHPTNWVHAYFHNTRILKNLGGRTCQQHAVTHFNNPVTALITAFLLRTRTRVRLAIKLTRVCAPDWMVTLTYTHIHYYVHAHSPLTNILHHVDYADSRMTLIMSSMYRYVMEGELHNNSKAQCGSAWKPSRSHCSCMYAWS